jgi:hypothetical protein
MFVSWIRITLIVSVVCGLSACAEFKEAGKAIGHSSKKLGIAIGHGTRDAAKSVAKETTKAAKELEEKVDESD